MSHVHHAIDYIELGAPNLAETKRFYEQVFGWQFNDYGPGYAGVQSSDGAREVGGLDSTTQPSAGGPLVLLFSDNLDLTLAAVVKAGGVLTKGPYEFPGGRRAHFRDVAGNELGVWSEA